MLQYHSHYDSSVLDGMCNISNTIKRAKELGYNSLGITDHGTGQGLFRFYKECVKENIKPVLGVEAYIGEKDSKDKFHIILIAQNNIGLKNIFRLITYGYMDNFYSKPRITMEKLLEHKEGIIITSSCLGGQLARYFFSDKLEEAKEYVDFMNRNFNFFVEMQPNSMPEQVNYNKWLVKNFGGKVKFTINADMHYIKKEDYYIHDTLLAMQVKKKKNDKERFNFKNNDYYMMSHEEITERMNYFSEDIVRLCLHNTQEIANSCNVSISTNNNYLPHVDKAEKKLAEACNIGFIKRLKDGKFEGLDIQKVIERIKYELKIICDKGYATYFLIVQDYINYAKNNNIPTGAGRGSVCGSEVAYILGIHEVEPISNGLLFERFLNPDRNSHPDIDSDFCYEKRAEIIKYIKNKYGENNVAHIIAEGTFTYKKALRDVLRTYDFTEQRINSISKLIPDRVESINEALEKSEEFRSKFLQLSSDIQRDILGIENLISHNSKHAAGVIIAPTEVYNYVPCMRDKDDETMMLAQWDKKQVEEIGLYKYDILGLKLLTIYDKTLNNIKANKNIDISMKDLNNIDLNDKGIYEVLCSERLLGVFQFEAPSASAVVNEVKPQNYEDIMACESICRPGVKESDLYIVNKQLFNNNKTYPVPEYWDKVKDILEPTYGAIVYQEQTMMLFHKIGGYTLGEADSLRKVKSLEPERNRFVSNAINKHGFTNKEANGLFDRFNLEYSFNKSHAAAYGKNSATCAYLIKYYPVEFFSAALSLELTKQEPNVEGFIKYCRSIGLSVLSPDINKSTNEFIPVGNSILMPLNSIDKIGDSVIEEILTKRPFNSLNDMLNKIEKKKVNKAKVKMLIKGGCFDFYNKNRSDLLTEYNSIIKDNEQVYFWCDEVQMSYEKQSYGFYLNKHPLDGYINLDIKDVQKDNVVINCIINEIRYSKDKNGNTMCFLSCSNKACSFNAIMFSSVYNRNNIKSILKENCSYKMYGTISRDSVIVSSINII